MIKFLLLMQIKHLIVDFPLQTPYQYLNKGKYGHPGGIVHSGLHAVVTLAILLAIGTSGGFALLIAAAEFLVHYHIDWAKVNLTKDRKWALMSPYSGRLEIYSNNYFNALGADQFLHQITYIAIAALL